MASRRQQQLLQNTLKKQHSQAAQQQALGGKNDGDSGESRSGGRQVLTNTAMVARVSGGTYGVHDVDFLRCEEDIASGGG